MTTARDLGAGVYQLDALYIKPGVACLYCVVEENQVAILETGTAHSLPSVLQFLADKDLTPDDVRYVVPTHVHLDHAGGAGVMMQAFPQAELIIHPRGARHMIDPSRLVDATRAVYGDEAFERLYGQIPPINPERVIQAEDGFEFFLGDRRFVVMDTPGHAFHHFCVLDTQSRGVFSGDTFGLSYPNLLHNGRRFVIATTTPTHFHPESLLQSIDKIMLQQPQKMYLTHFGELPAPASHVDEYKRGLTAFVEMTESIAPDSADQLDELIAAMGKYLMQQFDLDQTVINGQLAMDIKLNSQGLAHWFNHRD